MAYVLMQRRTDDDILPTSHAKQDVGAHTGIEKHGNASAPEQWNNDFVYKTLEATRTMSDMGNHKFCMKRLPHRSTVSTQARTIMRVRDGVHITNILSGSYRGLLEDYNFT